MKKILNTLLVLVMVLVLIPTTFVSAAGTGSITVTNAVSGKTYSIYKIFDLESYVKDKAYTYTIAEDSKWYAFVTTGAGKDYVTLTASNPETVYVVTWKEDASAADFSRLALAYAKDNNIEATKSNTTGVFTELELGYYLVDSSVGALCGLTTTEPTAEIIEKNSVPTVEKEVKEDSTGEYDETNSAKIGDTVNFQTTINTRSSSDTTYKAGSQNFVLYDKMSDGLTLDSSSIKVYKGSIAETNLVASTNYTLDLTNSDYTFVITFKNEYTNELDQNTNLYVTYSATLNNKAAICYEKDGTDCDANTNETKLGYGDNHFTDSDSTKTYTYEFEVVKTDEEGVLLDGAKFELYLSADGKNDKVTFTVKDGVYFVDPEGTVTEIVVTNGLVRIAGLDLADTYYLEETDSPEGYNKLTERKSFALGTTGRIATLEVGTDSTTYTNGGLQVINKTGAKLPSTGGIGTLIFVTLGSIMALAFGILLVTKLRLSKMEA